jgi:hypothetical protein
MEFPTGNAMNINFNMDASHQFSSCGIMFLDDSRLTFVCWYLLKWKTGRQLAATMNLLFSGRSLFFCVSLLILLPACAGHLFFLSGLPLPSSHFPLGLSLPSLSSPFLLVGGYSKIAK